jgi:tryptophanyl-tRNA synthetase
MSKKILLSGVKPTGRLHLANYFGAMKQFVDLANDYESYIFIADYHALNFIQNKKEMHKNIVDVLLDYLAIGLDPKNVTLFKQSDISEHTELSWIFDTITTMPYLERAHAYKDAIAKNKEINVGTFNYPMLMSADILLYSPDVVPVGPGNASSHSGRRHSSAPVSRQSPIAPPSAACPSGSSPASARLR